MTKIRPTLHLQEAPEFVVPLANTLVPNPLAYWRSLTQEQRRRMTVPELIKAMGPLHVNHQEYQGKAPPVISVVHRHENLVGRHDASYSPVYKESLWGSIKTLFARVLR